MLTFYNVGATLTVASSISDLRIHSTTASNSVMNTRPESRAFPPAQDSFSSAARTALVEANVSSRKRILHKTSPERAMIRLLLRPFACQTMQVTL